MRGSLLSAISIQCLGKSMLMLILVQFSENTKLVSSNINQAIREVLNSLLSFYKKILHVPKAPKAQMHKKATKQKHKNANKRTKIKNALKNI